MERDVRLESENFTKELFEGYRNPGQSHASTVVASQSRIRERVRSIGDEEGV